MIFGPGGTFHSGIDLITFTRSANKAKRVSESAAGTLRPTTLGPGGDERRAVADTDPEKIAFFGRVALVPINFKPGRHGLASALFENFRFRPVTNENSGFGVEFG
jgi:hypothetical protein